MSMIFNLQFGPIKAYFTQQKISFMMSWKNYFSLLRKEGLLFFSLKRGEGESRDKLGRFYSYYEKNEVEKYLEKANFQTKKFIEGASVGLAGKKESWMGFFCEKIL